MFDLLIVDDEDIIVEGLQLLIPWKELDVNVVATANSGEEALAIIEKQKIDLLLTDISMDEVSGLDLIEALSHQQPFAKSIVLSGFNEFEYIKRGLQLGIENYLLKPVNKNELLQTIEAVTEKLRYSLEKPIETEVLKDHITKRIFFNQIEKSEFLERATLLNLKLPANNCRACILTWRDDVLSNQSDTLYPKISNSLSKHGISYLTQLETNSFGFLVNKQDLSSLKSLFKELEKELKSYTCLTSFNFYIGAEHPLFHQFHLSIESAETMQEFFSLLTDNTSYFHDEFVAYQQEETHFAEKDLFIKLDSAIDLRNKAMIQDQIQDVFNSATANYSSSIYLTNIAYVVMLKLFQGFHKVYLDEFQTFVNKLNHVTHVTEITDLLQKVVEQVFADNKTSHYSDFTRDVLEIVATSYQKSLSLKAISKSLHVNTAYLGQLFQKEVAISFSEYLNNYRMQVAKQQLRQSSNSIETIALGVGFKDVSYFSRKFKQLFNQPPNEYRNATKSLPNTADF